MKSINKVTLLGNIGADPELRYTQSSTPVVSFSLATNEQWQGKDGQKQERTYWHECLAWGKLAETISKYVKKGARLIVEGKLTVRTYEDASQQKRRKVEVLALDVTFLDAKKEGPQGASSVTTDDDIPF